jgi:nucleotide-binding universal stress UspA family protein
VTQRYVVGIDGSRPGDAALRWTIARAHRDPAPIVLVNVDEDDTGSRAQQHSHEQARPGAVLLAAALAVVLAELPDVPVSVELLAGGVARAMADFVGADDLLVIGTGKTGFLHGRVLGSRSVQIALAAACSVAVIPDVDLRFRRGVVAGIDRHETAPSIARAAGHEAEARNEELLLVQAVTHQELERSGPRRSGLAVSVALAAARAACPALELRTRLSSRAAAEALLDTSRDKALLVLGPGSLDRQRSLIGTVLHEVLLNVNAPVLVARPVEDRQLVGPVAGRPATLVSRRGLSEMTAAPRSGGG